ncbi:MAG TPA: hypothetical protein VNR20_04395 [Terriglobales bacterium]|nr:hypothetical protein [Terriglobales bacterium]
MSVRVLIAVIANFAVMTALIVIAFRLFGRYHSSGKWAKNMTGLLAGIGMLMLALGLLITPRNAEILAAVAETRAYLFFLIGSNAFLLSAIAAYGVITYWKPLRLRRESELEKGLRDELPKVP